MLRWVVMVLAVGSVAGCGIRPSLPFNSGNGDQALTTPAPAFERDPHRQYFDKMRKRYYYYDVARKSYFWEDGTPKG